MNVALLISGYLRSFKLNIQNIKEKIINKFDNVDIYIHITKNEKYDDKYLNINDDINYIIEELNPILILTEYNYFLSSDKKINNLLNSWLKQYKLNNLKNINEIEKKYDLVIKIRPDLNIISDNIFNIDINPDTIYIPKDSKIDINKLKNITDNYICDIFAFGSSDMMNKYFSLYEQIQSLMEKYGNIPETILYQFLNDNNIKYELIDINYNIILSDCNIFSITGDSGSGKTKLSNILKKHFSNSFLLECDRYHKWERNDKNWENFTHLNPESNLISKMNSDIFDLKIGKEIYHVNYNHATGKFTDQEKIESTDNIIVCGLHNLYNNDYLYNLKIFIDTDENLKKLWKINRDVKERGYTVDKSIEQIENRKKDYEEFIKPQKYKSDLIINFYTDENFDITRLNENFNIKLKVLISQKYNIHKIINKFNNYDIKYISNITENFFEIIFDEYTQNNIYFENLQKEENFYDYIMLIIYNMIK